MAVASNNAILNIGRLNAFRLNYVDPALKAIRDRTLTITLDGVPLRVKIGSLRIHDVINDAPNTAAFTLEAATAPARGKRVRIVLGVDPAYLLFAGTIQAAAETYVGRIQLNTREWRCEAIDDTARGDWLRPFGAWDGVSASTVAQQLIANFAPGYSSAGVQAGLPRVTLYLDGTERLNGALRLLAKLIGGYYYVEDYVLHLFQGDEAGVGDPDHITGAPGQLLHEPPITTTTDDSQIRTRCYGKGHSEPTLEACSLGETRIPIQTAVMFNAAGGKAISEWQRLTYTGVSFGGAGALVGPGVAPTGPPLVAPADGGGVEAGAHTYAYTWVTAAGETLPSPAAVIAVTGGSLPPPALDYVQSGTMPGGPPLGTSLSYALVITNGASLTTAASAVLTLGFATGARPVIAWTISANMVGRIVTLYRQDNGGGWNSVTGRTYGANQPTGVQEIHTDMVVSSGGAGVTLPTVGNYIASQVQVSGIAAGPAAVTSRRLYRTTAGTTTPYKLVVALADNTTLTYLDAKADAALGAAPPVTDTSGLTMPAGQVLPGATAMPVAGTAWALPAPGGWAIVGNGEQIIRYTGISGNQLTGIPASGPGALMAAVNYNATITGAPMLLGVNTVGSTGLAAALIKGAPVNLWVQVDDTAAQAELAARVGGSGIVEQLIQDERRGEPSLVALCTADLARYSRPIITCRYTTFDPKSRSGRTVRIDLTMPPIAATLVIQDVTIEKPTGSDAYPRFTVTASSIRTSLEDLLRRMAGTLEEGF